jgi:hypothetical protein
VQGESAVSDPIVTVRVEGKEAKYSFLPKTVDYSVFAVIRTLCRVNRPLWTSQTPPDLKVSFFVMVSSRLEIAKFQTIIRKNGTTLMVTTLIVTTLIFYCKIVSLR